MLAALSELTAEPHLPSVPWGCRQERRLAHCQKIIILIDDLHDDRRIFDDPTDALVLAQPAQLSRPTRRDMVAQMTAEPEGMSEPP